jgi:TetR/AcrR family transcriptional regulator
LTAFCRASYATRVSTTDPKPSVELVAPISASSRDKILDTAEPLFARSGFAGVGLREVAERAGLGKSSLFYHFPSKVKLYVAVLERVFGEFDARLGERSTPDVSPLARLHSWTDAVVEALAAHPSWASLLVRSLFDNDVAEGEDQGRIDELFGRIVKRIGGALEEGIRSGEIRPVSIPHTIQTLIAISVFHFASGDLGSDVLGESVYEPEQVRLRQAHIHDYLDHGLRA